MFLTEKQILTRRRLSFKFSIFKEETDNYSGTYLSHVVESASGEFYDWNFSVKSWTKFRHFEEISVISDKWEVCFLGNITFAKKKQRIRRTQSDWHGNENSLRVISVRIDVMACPWISQFFFFLLKLRVKYLVTVFFPTLFKLYFANKISISSRSFYVKISHFSKNHEEKNLFV